MWLKLNIYQSANLVYTSKFIRRTARKLRAVLPIFIKKKVFLTNKLLNCNYCLLIGTSAVDAEWPRTGLV